MNTSLVRQAIVISDLHAGCQFGLCPPHEILLDGGGVYRPSLLVNKMWGWWEEMWDKWVPAATHHEPYAVVVNGDITDGRHHGTTTQITQNLSDQRKIALEILSPIVKLCEGRFYVIRGTEAHTGATGENEETLAQELGAIPDENGNYARWELWLRMGNRLAHIMHHIGTTGSMAYETTALMKEYSESCAESARWNRPRPDWVIRSHRHRNAEIRVPTDNNYGICAVTPGWQLKTPLTHRLPGGRITTPQCGAILIRVGDEEHYSRHYVKNISRTPEVVL